MPAKSEKQRRAMQAALHGSGHPTARKLRQSLSTPELREFAKGIESERGGYDWRQRQGLKQNRGR